MSLVSSIVAFVVSWLIGTVGILLGVRMVIDRDVSWANAALTALLGALVWGVLSFLEIVPVLGILLMLVAWVGVINWRYPGGWISASAIGLVAWIVAVLIVIALATLGVAPPDAFGIPFA